jgi:hypothetical protein
MRSRLLAQLGFSPKTLIEFPVRVKKGRAGKTGEIREDIRLQNRLSDRFSVVVAQDATGLIGPVALLIEGSS